MSQAKTKVCKRHSVERSVDRPFQGPVGQKQNPAAHGNITVHETCACGAKRLYNVNGRHIEKGVWFMPDRG